jgi:uncharacterized membrane protein YdfJ with MMPL/SSD domain
MGRRRMQPPARPLAGYRDQPEPEDRLDRRSQVRAWVILAILVLGYLAFMLPVYFLEPGLR